MKSRAVALIVLVQVALAVALVVVAFLGQQSRASLKDELGAARAETSRLGAELATTKKQAAKDRAQMVAQLAAARARVDALEAALRRQGVDPGSVIVVRAAPARSPSPGPASARPSPTARPTVSDSPRPSPTSTCTVYSPVSGRCVTIPRSSR